MMNVLIYMTSGRTLCERQTCMENVISTVARVKEAMETNTIFWFGRARVNPECVEGVFASTEPYCDYSFDSRMDIEDLVEEEYE